MDMLAAHADAATPPATGGRRLRFAIAVVAFQALAAVFFVIDSVVDAEYFADGESPGIGWLEVGLATALLAGIVLGGLLTRRLFVEARERERVLAVARGALSEVIVQRFAEWSLSAAEADVAMFALKGCTIAQIAAMRDAAAGTVRAQLSQVYAKAGVSSQPMFVSLFVEELLER